MIRHIPKEQPKEHKMELVTPNITRRIPKYNHDDYSTANLKSMLYQIRYDMDFERFYRDRISGWKCCGDYGKGCCPFCKQRPFYVDLITGKARCRRCSWRGDPVSFTQRHLNVALHVAIDIVYKAEGVAL